MSLTKIVQPEPHEVRLHKPMPASQAHGLDITHLVRIVNGSRGFFWAYLGLWQAISLTLAVVFGVAFMIRGFTLGIWWDGVWAFGLASASFALVLLFAGLVNAEEKL